MQKVKRWTSWMLSIQRMWEAVTVVSPKSPGSIASCSWKSVRTADPHTSPIEIPKGHFCRGSYKMMVGYKTNVPHNPPPFSQPLLSCLLPEACYLCQNGTREKSTLAVPAGDKDQGCRLCLLTKILKSGHNLFLVAFSPTAPQRIYLTTHETGTLDWILNFAIKVVPHHKDLSHVWTGPWELGIWSHSPFR